MDAFAATISNGGPEVVVRLEGELDLASAPGLAETLDRIPDGAAVVLDLGNASFVGAAALHVILDFVLADPDRSLSIQHLPQEAARMIRILDLRDLTPSVGEG